LKLRIQVDIQARAPGIFSRRTLSGFLQRHTTGTAYLKALVNTPLRSDLDGQPAGEVTDEHRAAATAELDRRRALHDARRAAEREAQREAQRAERERQRESYAAARAASQAEAQAAAHATAQAAPPAVPAAAASAATSAPAPAPAPARTPARPPTRSTEQAPVSQAREAEPADQAGRRERANMLHAFETSTLTRSNFCVLKRIAEAELEAMLAQARQEREQRPPPVRTEPRHDARGDAPPRRPAPGRPGPRPDARGPRPPRSGPPRPRS